jgi:hypothetical protein
MNKEQILTNLFNNKAVEEIINNITKTQTEEDLAQDIYLALCEKDEDLIVKLFENNQLMYFITRMVLNNVRSVTSPYYYKYKRFENNKVSLDEIRRSFPDTEDD